MVCNVRAERQLPFTSVTLLTLPKPKRKLNREDKKQPLHKALLLTIQTKLKNHMYSSAT